MNSTERSRKRREKLKQDPVKYEKYLQKEKERDKVKRGQMKEFLSSNTAAAKKVQKIKRLKQNERQRRCRQESKKVVLDVSTLGSYCSPQTFGKALQRAKRNLPQSPRKRYAVVKKLADLEKNTICLQRENGNSFLKISADHEQVIHFFERDGISRESPNKKDYIKVIIDCVKTTKMKRHMTMTIDECFALFKEEYPNLKVGRSKFFELRPPHVFPSSKMPHNVCVCRYHSNMALLLEGLKLKDIQKGKDLIYKCTCAIEEENCMMSSCPNCPIVYDVIKSKIPDDDQDLIVKWKQWVDIEGRPKMIEESGSMLEIAMEIGNQFSAYKKHCFIKEMQAKHFQGTKDTIVDGEIVLQVDFAENYSTVIQDEIQAAHWSHSQVTLFTAVVSFPGNKHLSCLIVSDNLKHGKHAVWLYMDVLIKYLKEKYTIKTIHIFSDGCAAQFKNRYNILSLTHFRKDYGIDATWSFFATSHGKGAVDELGAMAKKLISTAVLRRSAVVQTASEFAKCAKSVLKRVEVFYIPERELQDSILKMLKERWSNVKLVPNIQSMHYIAPVNERVADVSTTRVSKKSRIKL